MVLVEIGKVALSPRRDHVVGGVAALLVRLAVAEEASLLGRVDASPQLRIHLLLHADEDRVELLRRGPGAGEDQVRQVRLVLERVRLRERAAVGVSEQVELREAERLADGLEVFGHRLDGVARRVLQLLAPAGTALVEEDDAVRPGERQEVREEIVVRRAGPSVDHDERRAAAERLDVEQDPVGVDEPLLQGNPRSRLRLLRLAPRRLGREEERDGEEGQPPGSHTASL